MKIDNYKNLLEKIDQVVTQKELDLSSDEDLSIAVMNLISIEEHLFFTSQKTDKMEYLDLLNEVRLMRTALLKLIIKDYEGEVWCISKHLLAATMRLSEVGTKQLKKGKKKEARKMFDKAFKLYSLFWGINLGIVKTPQTQNEKAQNNINLIDEKKSRKESLSVLTRLGTIVKKAVDCCRE